MATSVGSKGSQSTTDNTKSSPEDPSTSSSSQPGDDTNVDPAEPTGHSFQRTDSSLDPRSCWICLQSEKEDTPRTSRWRSPCACRLQAHEACLLDWVAEEERPRPGRSAKTNVQCPQCRTSIKVIRPRSYFLPVLRRFQGLRSMAVLPATGICLFGALFICCYEHGKYTVLAVLGPTEGRMLLSETGDNPAITRLLILPLIPLGLLLSRTPYGRKILPLFPFMLLGSNGETTQLRIDDLWPPSHLTTLAFIPWARFAYDKVYDYLFAQRASAWVKEIQPRGSDPSQEDEPQPHAEVDPDPEQAVEDGHQVFELGIQVELEGDEEGNEPPASPVPAQVQAAEEPGQNEDPDGHENPPAPAEPQGPEPQPHQQGGQGNRNGNVNAANAANAVPILLNVLLDNTLGSLFFPFAAAGVGYALNLALPSRWTVSDTLSELGRSTRKDYIGGQRKTTGFLQTHFGRTVAGGFLFVLLKDSLSLYSKFRTAQLHRQRRIANYDARKRHYSE